MGCSTGHMAYLRLKSGVASPRSGSIELSGPVVAEQIGGQIFIDAFGLVARGKNLSISQTSGRIDAKAHGGPATADRSVPASAGRGGEFLWGIPVQT